MTEQRTYLKNKVEGMTPDERIAFIYINLLEVLQMAKKGILESNIEFKTHRINKAIEIIAALVSILDMEAGGEVAVRLRSIYIYAIDRLTGANTANDVKALDEMIGIFRELHTTWREKIVRDRKTCSAPRRDSAAGPSVRPREMTPVQNSGIEVYG